MRLVELRAKAAVVAAEHRAGDGFEQRPFGLPDLIASEEKHTARALLPRAPRPVVEKARQALLHFVDIAVRMVVEDDDVGAQALEAPVLLRLKDVRDQCRL